MTKTNNTHRSTDSLSLVPVSLPLGSVGGVLPLSIEHAPAVPEVTGQVRPTGRLRPVFAQQIEDAPRAASELLAFPDYERLFGALVPRAKDIAEAMVFAHAWTLERRSAERWFDHTRDQEMLAWDHAMGLVADLTGPLLLALERHPALEETLPVLMRFALAKITAGKRAAKRAVRARKAAAKEEVPKTEELSPQPLAVPNARPRASRPACSAGLRVFVPSLQERAGVDSGTMGHPVHDAPGESLAELLEDAPVLLVWLDCNGRVERTNRRCADLAGWSVTDLEGRDWFATSVIAVDRDRARANFLEAVRACDAGPSADPPPLASEPRLPAVLVTRDGHELAIAWRSRLRRDAEGRLVGVLAIGMESRGDDPSFPETRRA